VSQSLSRAVIRSAAPVRICDLGGWTDTWFARHGCVLNLAVEPCVEVQIGFRPSAASGSGTGEPPLTIHAENFGPAYLRDRATTTWDQHPLIEAALESLPPLLPGTPDVAYSVNIYSAAPPGASVGSSSAAAVALLAATSAIASLRDRTPESWAPERAPTDVDREALAAAAHRLETDRLGQQCGVQDQIAAAYGGACFIEIDQYPHAHVTRLPLGDALRWELETRLALVYLGKSHDSSSIHERVIQDLAGRGPDAPPLQALRRTAIDGRDALLRSDLTAFGTAMQANTEAQALLHPDLVGADAQRVIAIAQAFGAIGWKVNGAGGEGGSITLLGGASAAAHRDMLETIAFADAAFRIIPIRLSADGVRVWLCDSGIARLANGR
jgi:D-glycero-alpha-D-manno-heptose-7-phosphate kinase